MEIPSVDTAFIADSGIDPVRRRIYLHSELDEPNAARIFRALRSLGDAPAPIELYVCTGGGNLEDAFAVYDLVHTLRAPVHTIAHGRCMSAGLVLLCCGKKRFVHPNTTLMAHDVSVVEASGSLDEMDTEVRLLRSLSERMLDILTATTTRPAAFWRKILRSKANRYFSADDALQWGLSNQ